MILFKSNIFRAHITPYHRHWFSGGTHPTFWVGMCRGKVKNGGSGTSSSVKMWVSGTTYWTLWNWLCIGIKGEGSLEPDIVKMRMIVLPMDGRVWLALWLAEWLWVAMNCLNGKKCWKRWSPERQNRRSKICLSAENGVALKRNIFVICENYMHRNENLGLKMAMGVSRTAHNLIMQYIQSAPPPRYWLHGPCSTDFFTWKHCWKIPLKDMNSWPRNTCPWNHCPVVIDFLYTLSVNRNLSLLQSEIHWNPLHKMIHIWTQIR